ncbi:MAG: MFS transporter, partial [Egibacteraceae bacterium]
MSSRPAQPARRARLGVAALFFVNGALLTNWLPRIPAVKASLGLSDGTLGLTLTGVGAGAVIGGLAASALVARFGSRTTAVVSGLVMAALLPFLGLAGSAPVLARVLGGLGLADAIMDVAMNAHAVEVQRLYPRSILNRFHALWSLGSVTGGTLGALAAGLGLAVALHLALVGVALAVLLLAATPLLLPTQTDQDDALPTFMRPTRALLALGLLTLLGAAIEDTPGSWSAVYLREWLGTSPGVAGSAYVTFTIAMTIGRLLGDRVVDRFGAARTVRVGGLVAAGGLGFGLATGNVAGALAGFALTGLAIAPIFPVTFGAAGNLPGVPPGFGIAVVSLIARLGFLLAPPLVGLGAELTTLPLALGGIALVALGV